MNIHEITDDHLNLFIDEQLDKDEMNEIREALLNDKALRERVCQLKSIRELIGYAYSEVPASRYETAQKNSANPVIARAIAACLLLAVGVILGWSTYQYSPNAVNAISAENTFQYVANQVAVDHGQRKIVLHIDSADFRVVNDALNEADNLLATYRKANVPMQLDVVTNKQGINILRPGVSPYIDRVQKLIDNGGVSFFACKRSIAKANKIEGVEVILMPGVTTNETARDIIPKRLEDGWVYIKA